MQFLLMFLPWIAYSIGVKVLGWGAALSIALVLAAGLAVRDHRAGRRIDIIRAGGLVFFTGWLIAALCGAPSSLAHVVQVMSHGWVTVLMWSSVVIGKPFTTQPARDEVPQELWGHPAFARMNRRISVLWATCFTVATAVMAVLEPLGIGGVMVVAQALSIIVPASTMGRYVREFTTEVSIAPVVARGRFGRTGDGSAEPGSDRRAA